MSVLVGKKAPGFNTSAVIKGTIVDGFTLKQFEGQKYVLLFFYPKDFTFVCPTELHAFQAKLCEFEKRNVAVLGCSTDSAETHWGWSQLAKSQGGIQGVEYPLLADTNKTISSAYGVLNGEYDVDEEGNLTATSELIAYRGLFLIDRDGIVRHQLVNDLPLGRSVDEALRIVDALQFFEKNGEVCPADWNVGKEALTADFAGVASYLARN
ncbi:MAG TPA: peroxiredoxin [Chthoniobacteraceae bacterium]|nr:peroxiredoxin [Chthoniobacteraceae bacterium]